MTIKEIFDLLKNRFENIKIYIEKFEVGEEYIVVSPDALKQILQEIRNNPRLHFDYLMCISSVDDANGEIKKDENGNKIIKGGTLSLYYHLYSTTRNHKIAIKTSVDRENPAVPTAIDLWKSADWHEREAFDMMGIKFEGHPNLKRILMPYDWNAGFPLRKDFITPEYYNDLKIPY
jgi:NADH-quinone oxidoreductase subunit C